MPRFFTQYWKNKTWDNQRHDQGEPLGHIAGNEFLKRGVRVGHTIYVVTVIKGDLYLCGKLTVGAIVDRDEAVAIVGTDNLWDATEHIIASASTPTDYQRRVSRQVTRKLRFITGNTSKALTFTSKGGLDQQTLRPVRELDSASAFELDKFLPAMQGVSFENKVSQFHLFSEDSFPEEIVEGHAYYEGALKRITVNVYERSVEARRVCKEHYGINCFACDFNFESVYGSAGKGFIEVHHLTPLSEISGEYELDPVRDLRPICPNCHAMIHRRVPAYTMEEINELLIQKDH